MAKLSVVEELESPQPGLTTFESRLLRVLGLILVQERQQTEQIDLLGRAGFRVGEIAALLGTTANTVSVALSMHRRNKVRRGRKVGK